MKESERLEEAMKRDSIRILLVEEDEENFQILEDLLCETGNKGFELHRVPTNEAGLEVARTSPHDVCLLGSCLGEHNELELLRELGRGDGSIPIILLTRAGDSTLDLLAMKEWGVDFLDKKNLNSHVLERAIRYSIERARTIRALRESQRRLHRLSYKLLDAQEEERKLVAQELHDSIGANLTAVIYALEDALTGDCEHCRGRVSEVISLVRGTMDETRRISMSLRPSILDDLGILAACRWFCGEFQKARGDLRIQTRLNLKEHDIPEPLKIVIYRVLQEALNNVAKHSGADLVRVTLRRGKAREVVLTIKDNGRGFDVEETLCNRDATTAMGLTNMRERTELAGGTLAVRSSKGKGTVIQAFWPLPG